MAFWVRLSDGSGNAYYWNPHSGVVCWALPAGESCAWHSATADDGTVYYYNEVTHERTWNFAAAVPATSSSADQAKQEEKSWKFDVVYRGQELDAQVQRASQTGVRAMGHLSLEQLVEAEGTDCKSWVEVRDDAEKSYFWNCRTGTTLSSLPAACSPAWRAYRMSAGKPWYYVNLPTGSTTWSIPDMLDVNTEENWAAEGSCRWIEIGASMFLTGLRKGSRYNDQAVEVHGFCHGRVVVKLADVLGGTLLAVRAECLRPLPRNTVVELRGLSTDKLNGEVGTIEDIDHVSCRYWVRIPNDENLKSVRGNKLVGRCRLWDLALSQGQQWLQWRKEETCLFIDSTGQHCKFSLHFPLDFAHTPGAQAWPLLVYFHGTGGSSFMTHSKKSLTTVGLQYAASKFVIVSPQCDWTWKTQPKPWVNEMVSTLRAASWIDEKRIYLTGCSMGGMSTLEVGAERPDLYAAIAPVAAHHNSSEDRLAEALQRTPTFVTHSQDDDTCPLSKEEPLWDKIRELGGELLQISLAKQMDHSLMFKAAFCDDTVLYDWLLQFAKD